MKVQCLNHYRMAAHIIYFGSHILILLYDFAIVDLAVFYFGHYK